MRKILEKPFESYGDLTLTGLSMHCKNLYEQSNAKMMMCYRSLSNDQMDKKRKRIHGELICLIIHYNMACLMIKVQIELNLYIKIKMYII